MALFTGLPNGNYTVTISGFDASRVTFSRTSVPVTISESVGLVTVEFQGIGPSTAAITGVVTVNGQAPAQLSGQTVTITLVPPSGDPVTGDLTGTTGEYAFRQLAAGHPLRVTVGNDVRATTVNVAEGQQLQANLEFATCRPHRARAAADRPGARQVTAAGTPFPVDPEWRSPAGGDDGRLRPGCLKPARWYYTVSIAGWMPASSSSQRAPR